LERPFWYDNGETPSDLYEEFAYPKDKKLLPDWTPAFIKRSSSDSSAASTSAGPSPSPEVDSPTSILRGVSPPLSPDHDGSPLWGCEDSSRHPHVEEGNTVFEKSPSLQVRKVFVGGIPQTVDQGELYKLFSKVARVKKAWLQMYSQERSVTNARKHRGFGFVVFSEQQSVDQLLGEDTSRFITFGEGLQFEVKRAVGKLIAASPIPEPKQWPSGAFTVKKNMTSPQSGSVATSAPSSGSPTMVASQVADPGARALPHVPPFPAWDVQTQRERVLVPYESMPLPLPSWPQVTTLPPQRMVVQCVMCPTLPTVAPTRAPPSVNNNSLMNFLVGQGPPNQEDLEMMLLHAMPDHYDD
jgi:hypothetical protein